MKLNKMFIKFILISVITACVINESYESKILVIFPMSAPSHYILGSSYAKGLAEAGHDVTIISPFKEKDLPKNGSYREIILTGVLEQHQKEMAKFNINERHDINILVQLFFMFNLGDRMGEATFNHPNVQKLIHSGETFDVVVVEQFLNEAMKVFAPHFKAHLIIFSTIGANSWLNALVCNPSPPSYVPEILLNLPARMNILDRFKNILFSATNSFAMNWIFYPAQKKLAQKYLPNAPPFENVIYNASLVFLNSHESLNTPVPNVPNMINIGGFHLKPPKKLPADLQKFLDDAKEGVVYFSMGSNLKSKLLPVEKRNAILNSFSKLKQKVLWKWEDDVLPNQPANVKLGKWLPQQEILAHPNVKVFITHGGLLSTTETVYHGVPIIAIPVFGDQKMNAQVAVNGGFGLLLPFKEISEEKLTSLLMEILSNPKYTESVQARSKIMRDRPMQPLESAVYWTEYVIRTNGARHLRVAGLDLSWYQYYLLDVFGLILAGILGLVLVIKKTCSVLCCKLKLCCKSKTVQPKSKKVKKN